MALLVAQISMANGDILADDLVIGARAEPPKQAHKPAAAPKAAAALKVADEVAPKKAAEGSAASGTSSNLRPGHARTAFIERSALKLDRDVASHASHGEWEHSSGVDRLFNSSMLQVRSLSKRFPHVFAQVPMHAGMRETSWLGSMAMILVVSGTVIFMVLLLFAFQEKVKKEYEPEKQSNPPLQFLRNNPEAVQNFGRRPASMPVPFGPASTSSVVSHMRDPRFAAGADQNPEVKEGSGAPWAAPTHV
jgi:hypothetical protein